MIKILTEREAQIVSGGGGSRSQCIWFAGDRTQNIRCYDWYGKIPGDGGWKVEPGGEAWGCAKWYCCENKGHAFVIMEHHPFIYNCATKEEFMLDAPNHLPGEISGVEYI